MYRKATRLVPTQLRRSGFRRRLKRSVGRIGTKSGGSYEHHVPGVVKWNRLRRGSDVRLLIDELGYDYADRHHINVPADVHVTRVFRRTGLVPPSGGREAIQQRAVELLPASLWKLDGTFSIGYNWCTSEKAWCNGYPEGNDYDALAPCPLVGVCRRVGVT